MGCLMVIINFRAIQLTPPASIDCTRTWHPRYFCRERDQFAWLAEAADGKMEGFGYFDWKNSSRYYLSQVREENDL